MAKKLIYNYVFNPGASGVGTVVVPNKVPLRKLLLITNVTVGTIIYNFADPSTNATVSYNSSTNETTFTLEFNTSTMSATDDLQIFYDDDSVEIKPNLTYQDPVEKLRVSNPQAMMDTDFEYSLQSTKWESIGLVNNLPSVFVAANEPAFTAEQINYIRPVSLSSGGAGTGSFQILASAPADRGPSGLTTLFGGYSQTTGTDEQSVAINFPWQVNFLGTNYTFGHINANGWFGFGTNSSSGFAGNATNPNSPTLHFVSVNNGSSDNNLKFVGTETYTDGTYGQTFRIRYHGANTYNDNTNIHHRVDLLFPQSQPSLIIVCHRSFTTDNSNEQMGASTGSVWISLIRHNIEGNFNTNPNWTFISATAGSSQYAVEANFTISHGRTVGNPISLRETSTSTIDGAYIVSEVTNSTTLRYLPKTSDPTISVESKTGSYSQNGNTITVTYSGHGYVIGDKVYLDFTSGFATDGTFEVVESPAPTSTQFTVTSSSSTFTSGNVTMFKNYKTPYTAVYTGGFYNNTNIPISNIANVNGTNRARITFNAPHGLFYKSPIYVVDSTQSTATWVGSFTVDRILSSTVVEYETRSGTLFANSNTVSGGNTLVYAKADSSPTHRAADGGVSINVGNSSPNSQFIRQTRKYFRYQSGKGVQFSSGVLFRPAYDINTVEVDTSTVAGSGYLTLTIETELEHGFATPTGAGGSRIRLEGFTVTTGTNIYNTTTTVQTILSNKKFTCRINTGSVPSDIAPGGFRRVEVLGWNDATVRSGLFDEQNGMFFEYNGKELFMVRRNSTQQLPGTATVLSGSNFVYGTKTKFLSTLIQGDYIVINGLSFIVNNVFSDTKISISPKYRPANSATNVKVLKTQELRIKQKDFNIDQLDGSGPSGYTLDLNRMQMIFIDYSWYGAGKIRYGIRTNSGNIAYFHEIPNNNANTEAYMRSGNLPGRFEIQNRSNRAKLTDTVEILTSFTSNIFANSDIVTINVTGGHGLQIGDTVLIDFSSTLSDGLYEVLSSNFTSTTFEIRLNAVVKNSAGPSGNIRRCITTTSAAPFTISVDDASLFPESGTCMINNEYMLYSKPSNSGTYSQSGNTITISGVGSNQNIALGQTVNLAFTSGSAVSDTFTVTSVFSSSFTVSSYYPLNTSGSVTVYNNRRFFISSRNLYGSTLQVNASKDDTVFSINQNCSPSLSHWGVSVIMDGRFDEDKSYLFTAANRGNVNFNNTVAEKPLVSIRLAPSADYGIPRDFGVRSLINRSALTLKRVGIYSRGTSYLITLKINSSSTAFENAVNWQSVGNGSLAQYMDFSQGSLPFATVTGGDPVFSFFAEEGAGRFAVTDKEIDFIRELGNSIIGGARQYPDGPDILTIFAQPLLQVSSNADARARFSWTESQG